MADTREKLIELLECFSTPVTLNGVKLMDWDIPMPGIVKAMADHLIANGVTLDNQVSSSKWIPVTERLPEEEDADEHDCVLVHTSNRDNLIVAREAVWKCTEFMTHWQPLHEPPKGE